MRAELLDASRPVSVVEVVRGLTVVQRYPYADIAPSADLVLWSRIGSRYEPDDLQKALEVDRSLLELDGMIRPMEDLALFLAQFARPPVYAKTREWLELNHEFREDLRWPRSPVGSECVSSTQRFVPIGGRRRKEPPNRTNHRD